MPWCRGTVRPPIFSPHACSPIGEADKNVYKPVFSGDLRPATGFFKRSRPATIGFIGGKDKISIYIVDVNFSIYFFTPAETSHMMRFVIIFFY
jgi:hypothetical protein